jgi:hypothetical protein
MALIKCLECSKEISNKVASCPHCGIPLATTQSISKKMKLHKLISVSMVVLGSAYVLIFATVLEDTEGVLMGINIAIAAIFIGVLWYLIAKARI